MRSDLCRDCKWVDTSSIYASSPDFGMKFPRCTHPKCQYDKPKFNHATGEMFYPDKAMASVARTNFGPRWLLRLLFITPMCGPNAAYFERKA